MFSSAASYQAELAGWLLCLQLKKQLVSLEGINGALLKRFALFTQAGDTSIGWALGYMLNLTNMIPAEDVSFRKGTEYTAWVFLILLFVTIILVTLVTMFYLLRSSKGHGTI